MKELHLPLQGQCCSDFVQGPVFPLAATCHVSSLLSAWLTVLNPASLQFKIGCRRDSSVAWLRNRVRIRGGRESLYDHR